MHFSNLSLYLDVDNIYDVKSLVVTRSATQYQHLVESDFAFGSTAKTFPFYSYLEYFHGITFLSKLCRDASG